MHVITIGNLRSQIQAVLAASMLLNCAFDFCRADLKPCSAKEAIHKENIVLQIAAALILPLSGSRQSGYSV